MLAWLEMVGRAVAGDASIETDGMEGWKRVV